MLVMPDKTFLKLFAGILITSEIRMHLNNSMHWKEAQILKDFDVFHLVETHFQDENYVGRFLPVNQVHLNELKEEEQAILEKIREYCPALKLEKIKVKIFPQRFIS